jgi:two-component system sensor histidine kinase KdpD
MAQRLTSPYRHSATAEVRAGIAALLMVAASTLVGLALAPRWGNAAVDLLYLPAVLGAAILGGLRPALLAALASALAYNYFFTAPQFSLRIHSPADVVTVVVLFLIAVVTSHLAAAVRAQAQIAARHAARNAMIAGLARKLLSCTGEEEISEVATTELASLFDCNAVMVRGQPEPLIIASAPAPVRLTPSDIAAAALVLETGQTAGRGVVRVDPAEWQFHAVRSKEGVIAAAGLARDDGAPPIPSEQLPLLDNLLDQVALALERARLEQEAREFTRTRERDRLRAGLLSTIGRDITPRLEAIHGAAVELRRAGLSDKSVVSILEQEATKLDRYIANLLDLGGDADSKPVEADGVAIDLFRRAVRRDGKEVHLSPKEYAVLAELAKYPDQVLTHAHLLRTAWGPAQERQLDYLRVAIRSLRQKLERQPSHPVIIVNEPAVGYRLVTDLGEA